MTGLKASLIALGSGGVAGLAILVRPSWALFVPVVLCIWVIAKLYDRHERTVAARGAILFMIGLALVMSPWWARNARIYGRFVPTALWMGASLYDGLNPSATGASDMDFLHDREIWPLDEQDQDAELTRRAIAFATRESVSRVEPGADQVETLLESLAQCRGLSLARASVGRRRRGAAPLRADRAGSLGPPARRTGCGHCSPGRSSISVYSTWSLPARCGIEFPPRCPQWAWPRLVG